MSGRVFEKGETMNRSKGFTLIELMVVVAILAILAAIALPSYTEYVKRGKITQAVSGLADMRVKLEQYFQDRRTYDGACVAGTLAPLPTSDDFTFSCPTLTATEYRVVATGSGSMTGFSYDINQVNARNSTVPADWGGGTYTCWALRKSGC